MSGQSKDNLRTINKSVITSESKTLHKIENITDFNKPNDVPGADPSKFKRVMVIDTETTGFNPEKDEIIELAFNLIEFDLEGNFYRILYRYSGHQEPVKEHNKELSKEVSLVTGLTMDDLRGKTLNIEAIKSILEKTDIVVAFNASFDRSFLEAIIPEFKEKYFACAYTEIPYLELYGFTGSQELLLSKICSLYYDSHGAEADVNALSVLLSTKAPNSDKTLFYVLLKMSSAKRTRLFSKGTSYEDNKVLREEGFRWNPALKMFYKDVSENELERNANIIKELNGTVIEQGLTGFNKFRKYSA